jgi:hypothetical protein
VERVRPKIVNEIEADLAYPPKRYVLCIVCQADCSHQQIARSCKGLGVARLKREVKKGESAANGGV